MAAAAVKRIHDGFLTALAMPKVKTSPEAATQFFRTGLVKYANVVKRAGAKID
jgi:hypothetical protein